jgi:hypothetical protein
LADALAPGIRDPTTSTWSILSAVNTVNLVNTVNAVRKVAAVRRRGNLQRPPTADAWGFDGTLAATKKLEFFKKSGLRRHPKRCCRQLF